MRLKLCVLASLIGLVSLGKAMPFDLGQTFSDPIQTFWQAIGKGKGSYFPGGSGSASAPNVSGASYYSESLVTTDSEIGFFRTSTGALLFSSSVSAFFSGVAAGDVQSQATCTFDRASKRWIIVAVDKNTVAQNGALLLAISDDVTLAGNWTKYRLTINLNLATGPYYLQQPSIGLSADGLALSCVNYDFDDDAPVATSIMSMNKPSAYQGGANNFSQHVVPYPTRVSLTNDPFTYFIWGAYTRPGFTNQITWVEIGNFGTSISYQTFSSAISQSWIVPTTNARSTNGSGLRVSSDWITAAANFQDKRLVIAHTIELATGQKSIEILSFTILSGIPTERQINRISGNVNTDLFHPSIALNQRGDLGITYNRSSLTSAPEFVGEVRAYETVSAQMMPATVLAPSAGTAYTGDLWSQYGTLSVDPTDSLSFWGGGAVFNASSGWAARMERASPVYPTISSFTLSPSGVVTGNNATGTVVISTPAPSQGFSMELADDSAALSTPDRVTVPAGMTTGTFVVNALPSSVPITRHVILKLGKVQLTRNLNILLPDITNVVSNQSFVIGGQPASFTVNANGTVGNSFVCQVTSSGPELNPPSTVTFSYGQSSKTFSAATLAVAANVSRFVSVSRNGRTRTATVLIKKA
ncbi:MAG: hypothetical protein ABL962_06275 [Fimbriimonadaceae bacterium]